MVARMSSPHFATGQHPIFAGMSSSEFPLRVAARFCPSRLATAQETTARIALHVVQATFANLFVYSTALAWLAAMLSGCSMTMPRDPVPESLVLKARVPELGNVRYWGDEVPGDAEAQIHRRMPNLPRLAEGSRKDGRPVVNYLALSSGGTDGAFAAGLLVGWTKTGRRPRFEVVTGVSAGALIAPFAFLGPSYDQQLKAIWTRYGTDDILIKQPFSGLIGGPALADTQPLAWLIANYVDQKLLDEIASEYRKGRILLIGTTNLDAQRPVVWNMGEIAISRSPRALELFRQVILASAAIPGLFPPVHITVEAGGELHEEMHVDGGATQKVFLTPLQFSLRQLDPLHSAPPRNRFYIIENNKLVPEWKPTEATTFAIAERSLNTLIKSQGAGDLMRLYYLAKRDGADFNLAAIPASFSDQSTEPFDLKYMRALFEVGYSEGFRDPKWLKAPPEVTVASSRAE